MAGNCGTTTWPDRLPLDGYGSALAGHVERTEGGSLAQPRAQLTPYLVCHFSIRLPIVHGELYQRIAANLEVPFGIRLATNDAPYLGYAEFTLNDGFRDTSQSGLHDGGGSRGRRFPTSCYNFRVKLDHYPMFAMDFLGDVRLSFRIGGTAGAEGAAGAVKHDEKSPTSNRSRG